jgi:hypothetical protein
VTGRDDLDAVAALDRGRDARVRGDEIAVARGRDAAAGEAKLGQQLGKRARTRRQPVAVDDDLASVVPMRGQGKLPQVLSGKFGRCANSIEFGPKAQGAPRPRLSR